MTKLKKLNRHKIQKLKLLQNLNTQIVTKLKKSNCDKTQIVMVVIVTIVTVVVRVTSFRKKQLNEATNDAILICFEVFNMVTFLTGSTITSGAVKAGKQEGLCLGLFKKTNHTTA